MVDEERDFERFGLVGISPHKDGAYEAALHGCQVPQPVGAESQDSEEDALSHFDESGLIVVSCDLSMLESRPRFSWKALFGTAGRSFWNRLEYLCSVMALLKSYSIPSSVSPGMPSCSMCPLL